MQRRWKFLAVTVTGVVAASIAFTSLAAGSTDATKVQVLLAAGGKLTVSPSVVKAGAVTFVLSNQTNLKKKIGGVVQGSEALSFVLLKTNLAPGKLPTTKDGRFIEEKGRVGKAVIIEPGMTATIMLNVKPGKYVALSNGAWQHNYGSYAAFKVTG